MKFRAPARQSRRGRTANPGWRRTGRPLAVIGVVWAAMQAMAVMDV